MSQKQCSYCVYATPFSGALALSPFPDCPHPLAHLHLQKQSELLANRSDGDPTSHCSHWPKSLAPYGGTMLHHHRPSSCRAFSRKTLNSSAWSECTCKTSFKQMAGSENGRKNACWLSHTHWLSSLSYRVGWDISTHWKLEMCRGPKSQERGWPWICTWGSTSTHSRKNKYRFEGLLPFNKTLQGTCLLHTFRGFLSLPGAHQPIEPLKGRVNDLDVSWHWSCVWVSEIQISNARCSLRKLLVFYILAFCHSLVAMEFTSLRFQ